MLEAGRTPELPPLSEDPLLRVFYDVGPVLAGGMGPVPLTHGELMAWQANTGISLSPGEVDFLRRLSAAWIAESHKAEKADCPAPWVDPETNEYRLEVLPGRIKAFLRD